MNADRRKRIAKAQAILETVRDEEQEALDNLPESLQGGERGEAMQNALDALEEILGLCETAAE